jgi:hypothetical protein
VSTVIEVGAGLLLLLFPAQMALFLLGLQLLTPVETLYGRLAGALLIALGVACRVACEEAHSRHEHGLVVVMLLYNILIAAVFVYAALTLGASAIGLWPAVMLHTAMAVWCVASLRTPAHAH